MTVLTDARPNIRAAVAQAVAAHGDSADALIPILSDVNRELGYLSPEALAEVGAVLRAPQSQVHSAATFYSLLSTQPRGRHVVQFCENAPCHVAGGRQVWQALRQALNLGPGQTSADGHWTLLTTSCIGVCGVAPVIVVDGEVYGNVTPEQVQGVLERYP
jgi:NADH-quinone oxidoreductase subunit E